MPRERAEGAELALFDVLGERWALRVLWELRTEPLTYRAIAGRVQGLSTSVLTKRLRELRAARLVEHVTGVGYRLTARGRGLLKHLEAVAAWARDHPC